MMIRLRTLSWFVAVLGLLSLESLIGGPVVQAQSSEQVKEVLTLFRSEFVVVTPGEAQFAGEYLFGDAKDEKSRPQKVKMSQKLEVSKFETYQRLYETVMGSNPSRWKGPRNSVEQVTVEDANQFCEKVTQLMRQHKLIDENQLVRLPTEVEWEYFARAGTDTQYSFGENAQADGDADPNASILDAFAWHTGNAAGNDPAVGSLKPNPWGLYDIHGYLWEICSDDWETVRTLTGKDSHSAHRIPGGSKSGVMRGGSWKDHYSLLRSSSRKAVSKSDGRDDAVGFRCVIAPM